MTPLHSPKVIPSYSQRATLSDVWRALGNAALGHSTETGKSLNLPPVDKWLEHYFRQHRKFGSRDRREIRDNIFNMFRFLASQDVSNGDIEPDIVLKQALEQSWLQLTDSLTMSPKQQTSLSDTCRQSGIPQYYVSALSRRQNRSLWSEQQVREFCQRQSLAAPLWIRLNPKGASLESVTERLNAEGIAILERDENAVMVECTGSLYKTNCFTEGLFEIQDFASQSIGRRVPLQKGNFVWDVCAGAGGKSLQLGLRLGGAGSVLCTDVRGHALEECQRRAKRSGLHNLHFRQHDALTELTPPSQVMKRGGFDVVFVDAPCTSSGTWRRNPEARFRLNHAILEKFRYTQSGILESSSRWVREGGHLVYATCSWLPEENEERVEAFLASQAGVNFECLSSEILSHSLGKSDTMFCAVLKKRSGATI